MIKKQTWLLLAVFLALAGAAIYFKYNPKEAAPASRDATPLPTRAPTEYLFPTESAVASLTVSSRDGKIVGLELQDGKWAGVKPAKTEADQASVGAAISQISAIVVLARLDLRPADAGLASPANVITVGFSDGAYVKVQIGDETPTGTGYYARKENGNILVVDKYGIDALLTLLTSMPFPAPPTPPPLPPTDTPAPNGSETPVPTATKSP